MGVAIIGDVVVIIVVVVVVVLLFKLNLNIGVGGETFAQHFSRPHLFTDQAKGFLLRKQ